LRRCGHHHNGKWNPDRPELLLFAEKLMDTALQVVKTFIALIHCTPSVLNTAILASRLEALLSNVRDAPSVPLGASPGSPSGGYLHTL
jgi:hypothetical protein